MVQFFVVFHKKLFDECYADIPDDILTKYFTFVAVNETIPKTYTPNKYKVINEWELPNYDSTFQARGYNENSVLYHIYANNLHKPYKYIGFFQYDMVIKMSNVTSILNGIETHPPSCFTISVNDFVYCSYLSWNEPETLEFIIDDYEMFFKKKFNRLTGYPLFNSYVIPIENYENIMTWVTQLYDKLYPWCVEPPYHTHLGHIGGIYERVMAYALGNTDLPFLLIKDFVHNQELKAQVY
jgi:hypothetical protein